MKSVGWTLSIMLHDKEQYLLFLKEWRRYENTVRQGCYPTAMQIVPHDTDVEVRITCMFGERLLEVAQIISDIENHIDTKSLKRGERAR